MKSGSLPSLIGESVVCDWSGYLAVVDESSPANRPGIFADLMAKAKKEAETLRKIMKGYVVTIDSLRQANVELMAAKTATEQQLGEVSAQPTPTFAEESSSTWVCKWL